MPNVRGQFRKGNQSSLIRSAFASRDYEKAMLDRGVHPSMAKGMAGLVGLGNWLSNPPTFGTAPTVGPGGTPTFTATGTASGGGSDWLSSIANTVGNFVTSRWGQQRGTITYLPDGTVVQKQSAGVPIATQAPYVIGGAVPGGISNQGAAGFALGTGTMLAVGGGLLLLVLAMGRRK